VGTPLHNTGSVVSTKLDTDGSHDLMHLIVFKNVRFDCFTTARWNLSISRSHRIVFIFTVIVPYVIRLRTVVIMSLITTERPKGQIHHKEIRCEGVYWLELAQNRDQ
jgi:hypothetical protein